MDLSSANSSKTWCVEIWKEPKREAESSLQFRTVPTPIHQFTKSANDTSSRLREIALTTQIRSACFNMVLKWDILWQTDHLTARPSKFTKTVLKCKGKTCTNKSETENL
jgi:hypothetical protein